MKENLLFLHLQLQQYQTVTNRLVKGRLLHCKRASFTHQKGMFYNAKEHLLESKRWSLKKQKGFYFTKENNLTLLKR